MRFSSALRGVSDMKERQKLRTLLASFFRIGVIGFGGGNALVPVMRTACVEKRQLVSDSKFHDQVFVANITPGALPVEIACGIGREAAGWKGMVFAPIALSLPGAALTVVLLAFFSVLNDTVTEYIQLASVLISVYILYQLGKYIFSMFREADGQGSLRRDTALFLAATCLVCGQDFCDLVGLEEVAAPSVSCTTLMLCVLVFAFLWKRPRHLIHIQWQPLLRNEGIWLLAFLCLSLPAVLICADSLQLLLRGGVSALMSFGGGDAYLGIADDLFVQSGIFSVDVFYGELVPVVNILPGSILCKMTTGMGYLLGASTTGTVLGGCVVAVAGFACGIFFSCLSFMFVEHVYNSSRDLEVFTFIKRMVRPIVSAFMVSVILTLLQKDIQVLSAFFGG